MNFTIIGIRTNDKIIKYIVIGQTNFICTILNRFIKRMENQFFPGLIIIPYLILHLRDCNI